MIWSELYTAHRQPDMKGIEEFVDSPHWGALCSYLEKTYKVSPNIEYSQCSMQRGWNVKYRKSSRALCTLYPEAGFFICMVSVGAREAQEAELILQSCTSYTRELYAQAGVFRGGRWLMIEVRGADVLEDAKALIGLRMKSRK